jgi:cystathionine gamma-synthase
MALKNNGFATNCIHAGEIADQFGAPHTPTYDTTTFKFGSTADMLDVIEGCTSGCFYTRYGSNPSITSVEAKLASLEQAESALVFASGMAAISATLLAHGERGIICLGEVYGGTWELMTKQLPTLNRHAKFLKTNDIEALKQHLAAGCSLVFFETPSNPLLEIIDISLICAMTHTYGAKVAIDSTFATPVNQQPLTLGADIVIHSATKYLGGHSDLTGGVVAAADDMLQPMRSWRKNLGQVLAPDSAHLLARSLATLEVRVLRQNSTAMHLANVLQQHPLVQHVYYPGLEHFIGHEIAKRQMSGFGGMISIKVDGDGAAATKMVDGLQLFTLAASLGGVESLVSQPALTSHRDLSPAMRKSRGITDNLIRLSIGLETAEDLENDLIQSLSEVRNMQDICK